MTTQQSSHFDGLLMQCRDLACERLSESLAAMLDKADESITVLAAKTQDQEEKKAYLAAKDIARSQRGPIESHFKKRYLGEFQQRTNSVKKIGQSFSEIDLSSIELEIVGNDDLNETLKFNEMGVKLRRYCVEELGALDQRVGVLLGDASLQPESNPFGPEAICDAYKQVCRNADTSVAVRMVLLKLFDDHVADDVRSIYKEVNELLVENAILPKIRYGVSRREGGKTPGTPEAADDLPVASEGDFFAALQKMMMQGAVARGAAGAGGIGGADGAGGGPVIQGPELLSSLTRIQLGDLNGISGAAALLAAGGASDGGLTNVLHELKGTSVGTGMAQMDAMTLDIVALLFDQLFDNPKIPVALKGLAARLQIPVLKVAIADKTFFSKKNHPARQVLDTLGEIAMRLSMDFGPASPLYARLEKFMQELVEGFKEKIEIFETVRANLEAIIAEDDQQVAVKMQPAAKALDESERLALARSVGREAIKARVLSSIPPRPVLEFLAQQWIKYLVVVHVRDGVDSEAWKSSLATVDQLVWSVAPKATTEERRALASTVPGLLRSVKDGLAVAGVEDAVCMAFFKDLMRCHTAAIQVTLKQAVLTPEVKVAKAAQPKVQVGAGAVASAGAATIGHANANGSAIATAARSADARAVVAGAIDKAGGTNAKPIDTTVASVVEGKGSDTVESLTTKAARAASTSSAVGTIMKAVAATVPKPPSAARISTGAAVAAAGSRTAGAKAPDAAPPMRPVEPLPEAGRAEDLDFTAAITIKNPFGDGEVKVDDLDFTAIAGGPNSVAPPGAKSTGTKPARRAAELPRNLILGSWVEILEPGGTEHPVRAKLHHVSPLKSHFLFVDQRGKKVYECSRAMLSMRLKAAEITILRGPPDAPLFESMMSGVFKKLGKPVPT